MIRIRILGALCAGVLASSLGAIAACGGTPDASEGKEVSTSQAITGANVSIALLDQNGVEVGKGYGVLVAPRLVLTSGHLIAGKYKWVVKTADGKQVATGTRGMTYDWRKYESDKAHPRRHDVGVIHLDESIKLAAYPKLVSDPTADGAKVTRVRGNFEQLDATLTKVRSAPNAWLVDGASSETLITGGAVYDARGIVGVVSGRGLTTGKLYVARLNQLVKWLAPKIACSGGATGIRTYATPETDKSKEICEDGGTSGTNSGNSDSSGSSGSTGSDGTPGNSGETGNTCDGNTDGVCSGSCESAPESDTNGSSGTNGSTGSGDSDDSSDSSGTETGGGGEGTAGAPGDGTSNTSNTAPNSESGGGGGAGDGTSTNTGKAGSGKPFKPGTFWPKFNDGVSDSNESCQGPTDNVDVCPPEPSGCTGSSCGGGEPDDTVDYGDCDCGPKKKTGGTSVH